MKIKSLLWKLKNIEKIYFFKRWKEYLNYPLSPEEYNATTFFFFFKGIDSKEKNQAGNFLKENQGFVFQWLLKFCKGMVFGG